MAGGNNDFHSYLPQKKAFVRSDYAHNFISSTRIPCELTE